ncbi:hypothetical protein TEA_016299 [Camellia sinensis var. sinensis]|uniref:RED-like N-terminal domain-containing protein n=1 Tax=Camellia sinensis var. sinensis TaxID=542762 RepID=A0A4S4EET4_CAMSN|nr:hypothetical protein TEA_016299 [Camellia sinensis var. sinensis]
MVYGVLCREEKVEEPELPKYRDRAKERREDQNPDYEATDLGSFHAVAPPGTVDLRAADAHKLSIEKSKYLGGDVEHTHLVKGLDYALLHKVRSEIDKKPDAEDDADGKSSKDMSQSPISEDMEESPRNKERNSFFNEPAYGPVPPTEPSLDWQQMNGYDSMPGAALAGDYQGEWQEYQYAEQLAYSEQYLQQNIETYDVQAGLDIQLDPRFMTQEEKDRGLGSVFKRDDQRLQQLREKDSREKDPNFISESYSECYPGYQEYNREIVDSDDEDDLSKMDMGGRVEVIDMVEVKYLVLMEMKYSLQAKGRLHRWDFETEEEWAKYNEQKEAMPKAAFQFGVKMQDGRKTRKQNKDQKLTNELHKINKLLTRKKMEKERGEMNDDGGSYDDESHPGKKLRL